jgi:hypothetical protein
MATAYTPGLRVAERTLVRKRRRLPLPGEVVVEQGDRVEATTVVARTDLPGNVESVNVANRLGIPPEDVGQCMRKKEGDSVEKGEVLAQSKGLFGLFKSTCAAPVTGTVESVSSVTGQVLLREPPLPVEVAAYIDGEVVEVMPREGVVVQTVGTFVQGIFGVGGETHGTLTVVCQGPGDVLEASLISEAHKGMVVVGGSLVTSDAIDKAVRVGAQGIVCGGIDGRDLKDFLGYDHGVAITGSEDKGITVIVTEGFGHIRMAEGTFRLLKSREGCKASINGATQIRAGVIRPEVVIPLDVAEGDLAAAETAAGAGELKEGNPVRIIRQPYFGLLGKVVGLPAELQKLETEAMVRVLQVELADGRQVTLPRANVELIER